jgi:hypothetical protein
MAALHVSEAMTEIICDLQPPPPHRAACYSKDSLSGDGCAKEDILCNPPRRARVPRVDDSVVSAKTITSRVEMKSV